MIKIKSKTNTKHLNKVIEAVWRYGENIMVLSPVDDVEYAVTDLEVGGNKFEVIMYGSLKNEDSWGKVERILCEAVIMQMSQENINKYDVAKKIYETYFQTRSVCRQKKKSLRRSLY